MATARDIHLKTVTFILAGGRGERLAPLTRFKSKPAVPFGDGHIIDFTLANCLRANLPHPLVLTQYQPLHLTEHVGRWWLRQELSSELPEAAPVCVPPPKQAYSGSASALFENFDKVPPDAENVLVLSADHIYEMDYRPLLRFHIERDAAATLASVVYPARKSREFGIVETDESCRISGFEEKPQHPRELPGHPEKVLANMGIYVLRRDVFFDSFALDAGDPRSSHDIGKNILPRLVASRQLVAFRFENPETGSAPYWKDVGTLDSYYEASMEWLERLPATHRLAGSSSIIADTARIHPTADVVDCVVMPGVVIGAGARIRRAVLDENVHVMSGVRIGYDGANEFFERSAGGVAVVPANTTVFRPPRIWAAPRPTNSHGASRQGFLNSSRHHRMTAGKLLLETFTALTNTAGNRCG
jgi:glucose-1-phosphate adenylyltransferase